MVGTGFPNSGATQKAEGEQRQQKREKKTTANQGSLTDSKTQKPELPPATRRGQQANLQDVEEAWLCQIPHWILL